LPPSTLRPSDTIWPTESRGDSESRASRASLLDQVGLEEIAAWDRAQM